MFLKDIYIGTIDFEVNTWRVVLNRKNRWKEHLADEDTHFRSYEVTLRLLYI